MSERIKYTVKQLKKDKFREFAFHLFQELPKHFNKILYGVIAIILVVVALYITSTISKNKHLQAAKLFEKGLQEYNSGDIEKALETFDTLQEKFPSKKPTILAILYSALIHYDIGENEKNIELIDKYLKHEKKESLRESAIFIKGLAYFNLGKWKESIETLSKIENKEGPYQTKALLHIGMAYEKLGQHNKAQDYYKRILKLEEITTNIIKSSIN